MAINTVNISSKYVVNGEAIEIKDKNSDGIADSIKVTNARGETSNWSDLSEQGRQTLAAGLQNNFGVGIEDDGNGERLVNLSAEQRGQFSTVVAAISSGSANADIQGRWADFVSTLKLTDSTDVNALVQQVLRESYVESTEDLSFYAKKVQFYNDLKKEIRSQLTDVRTSLAQEGVVGADDATPVTVVLNAGDETMLAGDPALDGDGNMIPHGEEDPTKSLQGTKTYFTDATGVEKVSVSCTKGELSTFADNLEEKLNSVGDDSQLANVDLQNMLQKQQQTLQLMSNISKMLNDTALSVIRKIGG